MLGRDEEHGWPNGHNARQTTAPTCSYNCFPLFSRFRRPWTTKGDLTIHWGLVIFMNELFDLNDSTWYITRLVAYPNIRGTQQWRPCGYPKILASWEHRCYTTWTNLGQNERYQVPAVWQSQDPSCWNLLKILYMVCVKIKSELGLFNFWSINLKVGIENEKRVKSVPQASLGGQSVKCSGRTNEPPEKFTFYFAHAKATPRNAKARHGRAHLLKLPKLPPPTHLTPLGHLCS